MTDDYNPWGNQGPRTTILGGPGNPRAGQPPRPGQPPPRSPGYGHPNMGHGGHVDPYALTDALERVRMLESKMAQLAAEARPCGLVVEIREQEMMLAFGPANTLAVEKIPDVQIGDRVLCNRNTMQAIEIMMPRDPKPAGVVITIERKSDDGAYVEGTFLNMLRTYQVPPAFAVAKGDRVVLDPSNTIIIGNLGKTPAAFAMAPKVSVGWDDVGGHVDAKAQLREAIELPLSHPELFAGYGKRTIKGVLLWGPPGCIAGDMHVPFEVRTADGRRQNNKGGSIEHLYRRFNNLPIEGLGLGKGNYRRKETEGSHYVVAAMYEDGKIYKREIESVLFAGVKECVRVRTTSGRELVCTADHPLATAEGFRTVEQLGEGSTILMHQNERFRSTEGRTLNTGARPEVYVKHHPHARTKIVRNASGEYEYKRLSRTRAVYEAGLNGLTIEAFVQRCNDGHIERLKFSDPLDDIHHLDENPLNDVPDNLVAISHSAHAREHVFDENGNSRISAMLAVEDEIESIEVVGERRTYDIRMKARPGEPRNFVCGDGFIVHNTGKTILAKACATAIAKAHGKVDGAAGFVYIKGPELLNPYIGKSEEAIRGLFKAARDHKAEHGYPSVIFIDECDALLGVRDRGVNVSVNATTVPQFLAEMDGLDDPAAIFILATNRPDALDPAVMREGRVDRKVRVDRPKRDDARQIFEIHLKGRPLAKVGSKVAELAEVAHAANEYLFDDRHTLETGIPGMAAIHLRDITNGAMIAEVVERSTTRAMLRDVELGKRKASGLAIADLTWAIDQAIETMRDLARGAA